MVTGEGTDTDEDGPRAAGAPLGTLAGADTTCLLDADPDLVLALGHAYPAALRERLTVPMHELPPGRWTSAAVLTGCVAALIIDGLVLRDSPVGGRPHLQLYGPGDLIDGRDLADGIAEWQILETTCVAVLGPRVSFAAREYPPLVAAFARRFFDGQREREAMLTIRALPAAEERLVALLDHLARRWGRVTSAGLVVRLPLTHGVLGRLIGAQRPTVSLGIRQLIEDGRLQRLPGGDWLLPADAADDLARAAVS
jgi:CRP/FNR family transcriptional regulator, cyclic AMP receptor protein